MGEWGKGLETRDTGHGTRNSGTKTVCAQIKWQQQEEHSLRLLQLCVLWPKFSLLIIFNKIFYSGTSCTLKLSQKIKQAEKRK